ncbi:capsule assembly Wzi family protein [Marinifilum fragile]|uniref:capsule assembly Wzi family protein n=1 Tax=Marinifilum fragile TaxID=570161 RepID=UPI002AA68C8E|nr:capsule assembly Wzi family protein [Marinifilum fragile]
MKFKGLLFVLFLMVTSTISAQKQVKYDVGISSSIGKDGDLPFWLVSNKRGVVPSENYVMTDFTLGMNFNDNQKDKIDFMWKASGLGYTGHQSDLLLDELFVGLRWKIFNFSLGQKSDDVIYNGISSTNGNLLYSNNARSYPRYEFSIPNWTDVPFLKGILSFKGLLSDGLTTDNRYTDNARIHHKNFYVKFFKDSKLSASAGMEHYALWSGTHPESGKISGGLDKYFKIFTGSGDDDGAFINDEYRLGDHIGSWRFDLYYTEEKFSLNAYYQSVFEDGGGRKFRSFPDALYGLYYTKKANENSFIRSAIIEFYHTTDQSGDKFGLIDGIAYGGRDNYFNHSEYKSGWTHYGRVIGSPLFITGESNGHTIIANNRFKAVHLGVKGYLGSIPYKTYLTFSKNYGTYAVPYENSLNQFSGLVELTIPAKKLPFKIDVACAMDKGKLLKDNLGFFIRLSKSGILYNKP